MVESSESSAYFAASSRVVRWKRMPRSRMGRPYLVSPIWRYGEASLACSGVPRGVDDEETGRLPAHLPAQHEIDVELEVVALERVAVHVGHAPHLLADHPGRVVERRGLGQALALVEVALEQGDDRLGAREAAAAEQDEHPLARLDEGVHLARDVDLVVPRVGAGVG